MVILNPLSPLGNVASYQLPAGYTRIEYLEGTGTQWIDPECAISDYVRMQIYCPATTQRPNNIPFGNVFSAYTLLTFEPTLECGWQLMGSSTQALNRTYDTIARDRFLDVIMKRDGTLSIDGVVYVGKASSRTGAQVYLFIRKSYNDQAYEYGSPFIGRLGVTELDANILIPCLDPARRPCMYNIIRRTTHYNKGTGDDFIAGPPIV